MKTFPEILASHHCFKNGPSHIGRIQENCHLIRLDTDQTLTNESNFGLRNCREQGGVVYRDSLEKNNESD